MYRRKRRKLPPKKDAAPAAAKPTPTPPPAEVDTEWDEDMTKADLYKIAKALDLDVNTRSTKDEIIEALESVS